MTQPVSHSAAMGASASKPFAPYRSTTSLLREAYDASGGDLAKALSALRTLSFTHIEGMSAIRVLKKKMAKRPGCNAFVIERGGFVSLVTREVPDSAA